MIIDIKQTSANLKNEFEVLLNDTLTYKADNPWLNISAPFSLENLRKLNFSDSSGEKIYTLNYKLVENIAQSILPLKWLIGIEQKELIYEMLDLNNQPQAYFYKSTTGFMKTNFIIIYNNTIYKCYEKSIGKTQRISIYENEMKIAEYIKPLQATNNLDKYRIYLLDQYQNLSSIISFFAVYFDYLYYRNSEIMVSKKEVEVSYTYDRFNKYYNKNWILENFDNREYYLWLKSIGVEREQIKKGISKDSKKILIVFAIAWALVFLISIIFTIANLLYK